MPPLRIDILTTFPEMFAAEPPAALGVSIPARARANGLVEWHATNVRDFAENKHAKTDDRPFGGGPGMVMMCQPIWDAVRSVESQDTARYPAPPIRVLLTPQGERLDQSLLQQLSSELATSPRLLLIAGHYEGIDERVIERLAPREISIGDYVLSGGELAAMILIDALVRLLPGALGDEQSAPQDSFSGANQPDAVGKALPDKILRDLDVPSEARLLDCPHYTRPRNWEGMEAPEVLFSGDHQAVARWRLEQRLARTKERRPDLLGPEG